MIARYEIGTRAETGRDIFMTAARYCLSDSTDIFPVQWRHTISVTATDIMRCHSLSVGHVTRVSHHICRIDLLLAHNLGHARANLFLHRDWLIV